MNRILCLLALVMSLVLASCGSTQEAPAPEPKPPADTEITEAPVSSDDSQDTLGEDLLSSADVTDNVLIAYFSHTGNTENFAKLIQETIGGDLFEIVTVDPYPEDYDECVAQARQEKADGYRPALKSEIKDMDSYDFVFIGFPNWVGTMPMPVFSFLEAYDLSAKTILPFNSYGGSAWGESISDIELLCPNSTILEGLAIKDSGGSSLKADIEQWLDEIGMLPVLLC